jgi:hypothetical protein
MEGGEKKLAEKNNNGGEQAAETMAEWGWNELFAAAVKNIYRVAS